MIVGSHLDLNDPTKPRSAPEPRTVIKNGSIIHRQAMESMASMRKMMNLWPGFFFSKTMIASGIYFCYSLLLRIAHEQLIFQFATSDGFILVLNTSKNTMWSLVCFHVGSLKMNAHD
jgi:hypothetical protein